MYKNYQLIILILLVWSSISFTKVDFVKIQEREELQIIIYTPDLSLIQEKRSILLKKGINLIEFKWERVLLDNTSIYFMPLIEPDLVRLKKTIYPEGATHLIWEVESEKEGKELIKVSYFIQGLSWWTKYFIFVDEPEKELKLENYATIKNYSGDDFQDAIIKLVLGEIHRVRKYLPEYEEEKVMKKLSTLETPALAPEVAFEREGLAEYYIYGLKQKETVKDKESIETLLMDKDKIPFKKRYYTDTIIGKCTVSLFYEFKNELDEPLPPGIARIFKIHKNKDLKLLGEDNITHTPPNEEVKLNIGKTKDVIVEKTQISEKRINEKYDTHGRLVSYDIDKEFKIIIKNRKKEKVELIIKDRIEHKDWEIIECNYNYKRIDVQTIQFELDLEKDKEIKILYKVRLHY